MNKINNNIPQTALLFYKIMKYPTPTEQGYFYYDHKKQTKLITKTPTDYSRSTPASKQSEEYYEYINKYAWVYKSLPFVSQIYLCNSLSFNALNPHSDIDITIITKKNRLWLARAYSSVIFFLIGIKRTSKPTKKFCLSFYISETNTNLYTIKNTHTDIYLAYWIAHLLPLYDEKSEGTNNKEIKEKNIREKNTRIKAILPNHPLQQTIYINQIKKITKSNHFKKTIETIHYGIIGDTIERCIKKIRKPIIQYKKNKRGVSDRYVMTSRQLLKFHGDKRNQIQIRFNLNRKGERQ